MTGYVELVGTGITKELPAPLSWELCHTTGTPCDSFQYCCIWDCGAEESLDHMVRFIAKEGGEVVFYGVVDECLVRHSGVGSVLEISGRGMAALLLDNEAYGRDYGVATLQDILKNHVEIHGISVIKEAEIPSVNGFSVRSGISDWAVLYEFCRYYGGVTPRFNRSGQLVLSKWKNTTPLMIGDDIPVVESVYRYRRYGVPSEILVRNKAKQYHVTLKNEGFYEMGGRCRRVMNSPNTSQFKGVKYDAKFRLAEGNRKLVHIELGIALHLDVNAGDLVELNRSKWDWNGTYRVAEVLLSVNQKGRHTRLDLVASDAVI